MYDIAIISVYHSQYVHIANLEFIGCGGNQVKYVREFIVHNTKFDGNGIEGAALELVETTAQIINNTFVSHSRGKVRKCAHFELQNVLNCDEINDVFVAGAIISTTSNISIRHSHFEDNRAIVGGAVLAENNSIINMTENVFINNQAILGGVLYSATAQF